MKITLPPDTPQEIRNEIEDRIADAWQVTCAVAAEIYLHPLKRRKVAVDMLKRRQK